MSQNTLRVLFCIGVNQNFFDATPAEAKQVWGAFGVMMKGITRETVATETPASRATSFIVAMKIPLWVNAYIVPVLRKMMACSRGLRRGEKEMCVISLKVRQKPENTNLWLHFAMRCCDCVLVTTKRGLLHWRSQRY